NFESWTEHQISLDATVRYRLTGHLYAGLSYSIDHHDVADRLAGGELIKGIVPGSNGGLVSGLGPNLVLDARDNTYSPTHGPYAAIAAQFYHKATGSEFQYADVYADLRHYIPIGNNVLALAFYGEAAPGDTPFYMVPRLGGPNLRG